MRMDKGGKRKMIYNKTEIEENKGKIKKTGRLYKMCVLSECLSGGALGFFVVNAFTNVVPIGTVPSIAVAGGSFLISLGSRILSNKLEKKKDLLEAELEGQIRQIHEEEEERRRVLTIDDEMKEA